MPLNSSSPGSACRARPHRPCRQCVIAWHNLKLKIFRSMKTNYKTILIGLPVLILTFFLGWWLSPGGTPSDHDEAGEAAPEKAASTTWTCSMHPQVRQPDPGDCPICAMDLIPLTDDDDGADDGELPRLRLSDRAIALMHIQTVPVQQQAAHASIRLTGRVAIDETRLYTVAAWFGGRVDHLFADFSGVQIRRQEHLLEIYSPQLFGAQEEFLQALQASRERGGSAARSLAEGAREKLGLLGLSEAQISVIEASGEPTTHLTYYSPVDGIVMERQVSTGQYVETGTPLYTVVDLTRVWLELEAYESDLDRLRFGQTVEIKVLSYPGEVFEGRIAYIDRQIDARKRTARVRVDLPNENLRLKPGMLATGTVKVRMGAGGILADMDLAGKWISPMHPQIVKSGPGTCDVCGMDLVPVEELGYFAGAGGGTEDPLVIPATAPLFTGPRSIAYVRLPDTERPTFEAREVTLGPRLGDVYPVLAGLEAGEQVVVHGQFKIDSELQIRGRPSMMAPERGDADPQEADSAADPRDAIDRADFAAGVDTSFGDELRPLMEAYLALTEGLADDSLSAAQAGLKSFHEVLLEIGQHRLSGDAHVAWMERYESLHEITHAMAEPATIENLRSHLQALTLEVERIYVNFGAGQLPALKRAFCPMVDGDQIGTWLQRGEVVNNPYWGAAMLRCGEVFDVIGTQEEDGL
ncbi:MAG: DUF3347 domain-containing protein [Puniceicoccaceae bacterium]|nr:MAG: DUF3347 domain-containing protein [Puniceicoccaceae bacterium]